MVGRQQPGSARDQYADGNTDHAAVTWPGKLNRACAFSVKRAEGCSLIECKRLVKGRALARPSEKSERFQPFVIPFHTQRYFLAHASFL